LPNERQNRWREILGDELADQLIVKTWQEIEEEKEEPKKDAPVIRYHDYFYPDGKRKP
jgi:hypothetical protein